jgi:uncharacterized protein (TIGR02246 family)
MAMLDVGPPFALKPLPKIGLSMKGGAPMLSQSGYSSLGTESSGTEIGGQIKRLRELWAEAFNARDLESSLLFYADDAVVLPSNGIAVRGAEAIRDLLKSMFDAGHSQGKFHQSQIEYSGNMAVEVGDYTVLVHADGGTRQDTGRYMATWRRQEDGEFRITVNVWSTT